MCALKYDNRVRWKCLGNEFKENGERERCVACVEAGVRLMVMEEEGA